MESCGKLWKAMEDFRRLWKVIESYGIVWKVIECYGKLSPDSTVNLWDVVTGKAIKLAVEGHSRKEICFAFSPDGNKLASESHGSTVHLWDVKTGIAI